MHMLLKVFQAHMQNFLAIGVLTLENVSGSEIQTRMWMVCRMLSQNQLRTDGTEIQGGKSDKPQIATLLKSRTQRDMSQAPTNSSIDIKNVLLDMTIMSKGML